jgi:hypothetical protein
VAELSFVERTVAGSPDTLVVRGGYVDANGDTTWAAGLQVTVSVTAGATSAPSATTGSDGTAILLITPDPAPATGLGPLTLRVEATVSDGSVTPASGSSEAEIMEPGLMATYSGGAVVLEGPVFNGYSTACGATDNNMYQNACTPLAESPVDWAWGGGFTVTWRGYVYSREGGDQRFNSYYWVDGEVYVEVDEVVIASLDTPGGGYTGTVTLPPHAWVPVLMRFGANGGSNNMHIGWPADGDPAWEPVPRAFLATPRSMLSG